MRKCRNTEWGSATEIKYELPGGSQPGQMFGLNTSDVLCAGHVKTSKLDKEKHVNNSSEGVLLNL